MELGFVPIAEREKSIDDLIAHGKSTPCSVSQEEMDREVLRLLRGGDSCKDRDYSFTKVMKKKLPPTIELVGCPGDMSHLIDEAGRNIIHFDDVPKVTPEQIKCGRTEPQEVEDMLDSFYKNDQTMGPEMAPALLQAFDTFMESDPHWTDRNVIGADRNERFDPNRTFTPITVRDKPTHAVDNPFYNSVRVLDPKQLKKKRVEKRPMPSLRTRELAKRMRIIEDTDYYTKRAQLQETKDELKSRKQISGEVIALQVERDRAVAEINTLDPLEESDQICSLRQHVESIDQRIDGYNYSYGVEPQALREPSAFEKFIQKVRGGIAYVGGKIVSGVTRFFGTEGSFIQQFIPILCGVGAFAFGMFRMFA